MGTSKTKWVVAIPCIALLLIAMAVSAQEMRDDEAKVHEEVVQEAIGLFCENVQVGRKISAKAMKDVLEEHESWLILRTEEKHLREGKHVRRADLCGADLRATNLADKNLSEAYLLGVNLSGKSLWTVNLRGADLSFSNMSKTALTLANLSGANLDEANLNWAYLFRANLSGANLNRTNLKGAYLGEADLRGARFESRALPAIDSVAQAKNLELMLNTGRPDAMVKLRKAFIDAGYREQARKITYAIKRSEYHANPAAHLDASTLEILKLELKGNPWKLIEDTFRYVFFDLPTQWGMNPGRAIRALLVLIVVFALPYIYALRYPVTGLIYRKWGAENRSTASAGNKSKNASKGASGHIEPLRYEWPKAVGRGVQFSLISAFHIGWRDLNVGNWISRLQPRDYTLYATGWVRSVAGIQSLISVYLLAMWALTYFGRPFD